MFNLLKGASFSLGNHIDFEIFHVTPEGIELLALLDTLAHPGQLDQVSSGRALNNITSVT